MTSAAMRPNDNQQTSVIIRFLQALPVDQQGKDYDPEVHCLRYANSGELLAESKLRLSHCATYAASAELTVLLAMDDVFLSQLEIKSKKMAQLLKAAPFMLEETLIAGFEDQHFSLAKSTTDDCHQLLVIHKEKMQACLDLLQRQQLSASFISADIFLLPHVYAEYSLLVDEQQRVLLRLGRSEGFCCSLVELEPLLMDIIEHQAIEAETINYTCLNDAVANQLERLFARLESIGIVAQQLSPDDLYLNLPALYKTQPNLLQGEYKAVNKRKTDAQPWRYPLSLALLWLLLVSFSWQDQLQQLQAANQQTQRNIHTLLQQYIAEPDADLSAEQQLTDYLQAKSSSKPAQRGFIDLLLSITPELVGEQAFESESEGINIEGIIYKEGQLQVFISAIDSEMIEDLRLQLADSLKPLEIDQLSINQGFSSARVVIYE